MVLAMRGSVLIAIAFLSGALPLAAAEVETAAPAGQTAPQKKPAEIRAERLDALFGQLHKSSGIPARAIEQQIWALWSASDSPTAEVLLQQAQRAIEDGAPAEALSILDRLIGAYPDYAEAWNKRATLYYLMKQDDKSLADISHVLELEPRHFGALAGKGMIYQRQKKYGPALAAFAEALAINPGLDQVRSAIKDLQKLEQGI